MRDEDNFASAPSAPSACEEKSNGAKGLAHAGMRTQTPAADAHTVRADATDADADGRGNPTVRANPLKTKAADGADAKDAKKPSYSGPGKTGMPDDNQDGWETF